MNIKRILKKVIPISISKMENTVSELGNTCEQQLKELARSLNILNEKVFDISHSLDLILENQDELQKSNIQNGKNILSEKEAGDKLSSEIGAIQCNVSKMELDICLLKDTIVKNSSVMVRLQRENLWAVIFNNTISGSTWLIDQTFSPGRWAMGYSALYILYRVLEQFNPHHILELGLGQSTKMITQYAEQNKNIEHFVVEHDNTWIEFFKKNNTISSKTNIICLDREFISFKDATGVRVFKDFKSTFEPYKFDLIVIDAPLGGDMKKYARIDVLSLIETSLCEQFVLMLDDVNRMAERNTMDEISHRLSKANIIYSQKVYAGEKETCIWTTPEWNFLCSL